MFSSVWSHQRFTGATISLPTLPIPNINAYYDKTAKEFAITVWTSDKLVYPYAIALDKNGIRLQEAKYPDPPVVKLPNLASK